MSIYDYIGILRAAKEIVYDNGMVHRYNNEKDILEQIETSLSSVDYDDLESIDDFLISLNEEEVNTLCCGEESECKIITSRYDNPELLQNVLDLIFES